MRRTPAASPIKEQWLKLLDMTDDIRARDHAGRFEWRGDPLSAKSKRAKYFW
jgi:hypothetical protein